MNKSTQQNEKAELGQSNYKDSGNEESDAPIHTEPEENELHVPGDFEKTLMEKRKARRKSTNNS